MNQSLSVPQTVNADSQSPSAPVLALDDAVAILTSSEAARDSPLYSLAFVSLVTRLSASGQSQNHAQLVAAHWPAVADLAALARNSQSSTPGQELFDVPAARAVTSALHLTAMAAAAAAGLPNLNPSPAAVLGMWITTKAYELPLFYASIKLLCDSPSLSLSLLNASAGVLPALWSSPTFFPIPMLALRWLYLWSKLAEPWPPAKRARIAEAILLSMDHKSSTLAGQQLAHLAATGILSHLPPTSHPPARLTPLVHAIAASSRTIDTQAFTYALLFLSAPRQQHWPSLSPQLASHLAPHLTETLCIHILPTLIPIPNTPRGPMSQMWMPLIGPLGHLLGTSLRLVPTSSTHLLVDRIVAAYAAVHTHMHMHLDSAPQSLLFLAVMLVQDLLLTRSAPLPQLASLLALVHPLTLKLAQYVPGAPPFPSYADVLADLTGAAVQAGPHQVEQVCEAVLRGSANSDAVLAFLATWLVSDTRLLLPLAPGWVLDRVAAVAGRQAPAAGPSDAKVGIERVAWEAAHWLVVQVLESDARELARVRTEWWVWYADAWWPSTAAAGAEVQGIAKEMQWRATSALAGAANDLERCMWLAERVAGDVVALAVLVNGVPREAVRDVMQRVEREVKRGGLTRDEAVAVVEQWDRVGGLRWDRAVEVARWWNRVVDQAGLMV